MTNHNAVPGTDKPTPPALLREAPLRGMPRAVVRWLILLLMRPFVALTIEGLDEMPSSGAFLLVSNHLHNADPIILQAALRRPVHFMAKHELFRVPILSAIIRLVGSFPVNRQQPGRAAIGHAVALLAAGIPVGLFPEGTRSKTGKLGSAFSGAGLIAIKSDCLIVPVAISGTERLPGGATAGDRAHPPGWPLRRYSVVVQFGTPFVLSSKVRQEPRAATAATTEVMRRISAMLSPVYQSTQSSQQ